MPFDHTSLDSRHEFIKDLVNQSFGREVSSISRLGRDSNNYAHLVSLAEMLPTSSLDDAAPPSSKPGTKPLPHSVREIVVRISNPDAMLNNAVRVENEVGAITLMQDALSKFSSKIVPIVYGWNTAGSGQGWIIQEYMPGEQLGDRFAKLDDTQKKYVLDQVAQIFGKIQSYTPNVTGFGGLNFNDEGKLVTGGLTIWFGGPFVTHTDMYLDIFRKQIELSKMTALVDGWKGTDLEGRLKRFDESGGLAKLLNENPKFLPTLVHGDLNLENILFDPETLQVTALLDFDFSHIGSPADEFFYSFLEFHGIVPGPFEDGEMDSLRQAQLNGFKDQSLEGSTEAAEVNWKTARTWQAAIEKAHVKSPVEIPNIGELAAVYWFLGDVCPPYFLLPRWLKRRSEKEQLEAKKRIQNTLDKYLKRWGY